MKESDNSINHMPIKFYSSEHKAYLADLNRCPSCGEYFVLLSNGSVSCSNDYCELDICMKINKKALIYYGLVDKNK